MCMHASRRARITSYYIRGKTAASSLPLNISCETLQQNKILHMCGPINDYAVQQFKEFDSKELMSTPKEGLDIDDVDEKKKLEEPTKVVEE